MMAIFNGQFQQTAKCRFSQQKRELLPVLLHSLEPIPISEHNILPSQEYKTETKSQESGLSQLRSKAKC